MTIDWVKLSDWLIGGGISLVFGVIGGFIGSWINYSFEKKREKEMLKRQRSVDIRQTLIRGVSEFMYEQSKDRHDVQRMFGERHTYSNSDNRMEHREITFFQIKPFLIGLSIAVIVSVIVLTVVGYW